MEKKRAIKNISQNKKARHDYAILENFEAGIVLTGTEVKSCRAGSVSLGESYAQVVDGNMVMLGANIATYEQGNRNNHSPVHARRLLMHKREIMRLKKSVETKGLTLIPLSMYFNSDGRVKVDLGLCRGKNVHDKRESLKEQFDKREMDRARKR